MKYFTLGSNKSSRSQMFSKLDFFKNLANCTEKHLCWSLFSINFVKKKLQLRCFPVKFAKFLRTPFQLLRWTWNEPKWGLLKYFPNNTGICLFGWKIKYINLKKHVRILYFSFDFGHLLYLHKSATLYLGKNWKCRLRTIHGWAMYIL